MTLVQDDKECAGSPAPKPKSKYVFMPQFTLQAFAPSSDLLKMCAMSPEMVIDHERLAAIVKGCYLIQIGIFWRFCTRPWNGLCFEPIIGIEKDELAILRCLARGMGPIQTCGKLFFASRSKLRNRDIVIVKASVQTEQAGLLNQCNSTISVLYELPQCVV